MDSCNKHRYICQLHQDGVSLLHDPQFGADPSPLVVAMLASRAAPSDLRTAPSTWPVAWTAPDGTEPARTLLGLRGAK